MSWTTMDVGDKLEKAVLDVGRNNEEYLKKIVSSQTEMGSTLKNLVSSQTEMISVLKRIEAKL